MRATLVQIGNSWGICLPENVIEQAMVFADGDVLQAEDLPAGLGERAAGKGALRQESDGSLRLNIAGVSLPEILDDVERTLILQAFEKASKVKTETARLLGIKTSALYYKLDKYEIG